MSESVFTDPVSDHPSVAIPKLAFPFRMTLAGNRYGAAQVEQDSLADVEGCAYAVLATPVGSREDQPEFGIEDPSFRGLELEEIQSAIGEFEPRAEALAESQIVDLVQKVQVTVVSDTSFIDLPIDAEPAQIEENFVEQMAEAFPGWESSDGSIETWIARWASELGADLAGLTISAAAEIFSYFGQNIIGIPIQVAVPAVAYTTWTMVDNAGYTILAGTQVAIPVSGDERVAFVVTQDVSVAPGATVTGDGEVVLEAVIPGEQGNGLTGTPELVDSFTYVSAIELETATADGVDAQTSAEYLDFLRAALKLLNLSPVLPEHVAIVVRSVPGVARVLVLDNYNPGDDTFGNEKMLAFAAVDEAGAAVSSPIKTAAEDLLTSLKQSGFIFNGMDPTSSTIKVTTAAVALPGFDHTAVHDSVVAALQDYLSPATWGSSPNDPTVWNDAPIVRRFELIGVVDKVPGVDYVSTLTLAKGAGSLATSDVTLDGPAAITAPGAINVSIT